LNALVAAVFAWLGGGCNAAVASARSFRALSSSVRAFRSFNACSARDLCAVAARSPMAARVAPALSAAAADVSPIEVGVPSSADARIRPSFQWRDPRFQHLAWALRAELEAEDASDPHYAESLGTAMAVRLAGAAVTVGRKRRALSARAAARVIDYIEAHLDERLSLDRLAALVELSVPHFNVLFRQTMGVPVHRYVVQRRLERARSMSLQGRLSAGQVALEVGFAHQSHMAAWMKREFGMTPRDIVRSGQAAG
jgi:AraC-like DNA-binding protein